MAIVFHMAQFSPQLCMGFLQCSGTVVGSRDTAVNKSDKYSCVGGAHASMHLGVTYVSVQLSKNIDWLWTTSCVIKTDLTIKIFLIGSPSLQGTSLPENELVEAVTAMSQTKMSNTDNHITKMAT